MKPAVFYSTLSKIPLHLSIIRSLSLIRKSRKKPSLIDHRRVIDQRRQDQSAYIKIDLEDVAEDVPDAAVLMTSRRQSKRESVIKKSLKLQEKLKERAKKKGVANPESGPSVDKAPAVEDNSNLTSNVNIDPNPADTDSSEQSSDEEVYLETIEEVEQELVDPNKANIGETEYNTRFRKVKAACCQNKY